MAVSANPAQEIYRRLVKKMRHAALLGEMQMTVSPVTGFPQTELEKLLRADGLEWKWFTNGLIIYWKPFDPQMPRITARELIQMGYNPSEGDLFKRILDELRRAIAEGRVTNQTADGQIKWVRQMFPIP